MHSGFDVLQHCRRHVRARRLLHVHRRGLLLLQGVRARCEGRRAFRQHRGATLSASIPQQLASHCCTCMHLPASCVFPLSASHLQGSFPVGDGTCGSCIPGCASCADGTTCNQCDTGYKLCGSAACISSSQCCKDVSAPSGDGCAPGGTCSGSGGSCTCGSVSIAGNCIFFHLADNAGSGARFSSCMLPWPCTLPYLRPLSFSRATTKRTLALAGLAVLAATNAATPLSALSARE